MTNKHSNWALYLQAKTWGVRPSHIVGIDDPYAAYCFDEAIAYFGNYVKHELESVEGKDSSEIDGKRRLVIAKIFDGFVSEGAAPSNEAKFRDPALDLFEKKSK